MTSPSIRPEKIEELIEYILQYGGRCRDCADCNGTCQDNGFTSCDQAVRRKQIAAHIRALQYGFQHGFISDAARAFLTAQEAK